MKDTAQNEIQTAVAQLCTTLGEAKVAETLTKLAAKNPDKLKMLLKLL